MITSGGFGLIKEETMKMSREEIKKGERNAREGIQLFRFYGKAEEYKDWLKDLHIEVLSG